MFILYFKTYGVLGFLIIQSICFYKTSILRGTRSLYIEFVDALWTEHPQLQIGKKIWLL